MPGDTLEDLPIDQLLARAKEWKATSDYVGRVMANPEAREAIQRAVKKVDPNVRIPEIDTVDVVRAEMQKEREARQTLEQKFLERDIRDRLERERARVMTTYGLREADMLEVEKLMIDKDNPIPTYDAAARVHKASATPSTPTPAAFHAPTYDMPEKDVWGAGIGNKAKLDKIAMQEAFGAFNEIMQGKVAGMGPSRMQ